MSNEDDFETGPIRREREALEYFEGLRQHLGYIWRWGDGDGGYVLNELRNWAEDDGHSRPPQRKRPVYTKAKIARSLAKRVMERDEYRCVSCGTHKDLSCDHIVPESKGGPTTFENLQTMCLPCNMKKGART